MGNVRFHYNAAVVSHSGALLVILASPSGYQRTTAGRKVKHNLLTLLFLSVRVLQSWHLLLPHLSLFSFLSPLISRLLPAAWNRMALLVVSACPCTKKSLYLHERVSYFSCSSDDRSSETHWLWHSSGLIHSRLTSASSLAED